MMFLLGGVIDFFEIANIFSDHCTNPDQTQHQPALVWYSCYAEFTSLVLPPPFGFS